MLISLDYDKTWTTAPALWEGMVKTFKAANHRFVCVTSRAATEANKKELAGSIGKHMPIVYCNHQPKVEEANKAGYQPDIWIDDRPETIPVNVEQWQDLFHLYKNRSFHSKYKTESAAVKTAQSFMTGKENKDAYIAIYSAIAGGKGEPLTELARGKGVDLMFKKSQPAKHQQQQGGRKITQFSGNHTGNPPWFVRP